jgi:hypothetical protein
MATLKSIPKAKVWYKSIKKGDKILVQLHPNHTWYRDTRDEQLVATVFDVHADGCFACKTEVNLSRLVDHNLLLIGPAGTDWEAGYPATIIKKIKQPIE